MCATSTPPGRSTTTTRTTATGVCGPLDGKRELLTRKGEHRAPSIKESAALPPRKNGGEYQAADGGYSKEYLPISEQPPFSNNTAADFISLYRAYRKTMRGKKDKAAAIRYAHNYIGNLFELSEQLKNRTYEMGPYNYFKVYEPKERDVLSISFRDKIVLHSLCDNILEPLFCKGFTADNYANQKGKGMHYGIYRLEKFMRSYFLKRKGRKEADCREKHIPMPRVKDYDYHQGWIIKGDIKKFFYSIDHGVLLEIVIRKLAKLKNKKDAAIAFWLCTKIINTARNPGIPIGNQTSQLFALVLLDGFDHFAEQIPAVKFYGRYMDDFFAIVETREEAAAVLRKMIDYIFESKLQVNEKTVIFPLSHGIDFLGFHHYLAQSGKVIRKLRRSSKIRMKRKINKFAYLLTQEKITLKEIEQSYKSWLSHIKHGDTFRLKTSMDKLFYARFPELRKTINKEKGHVQTSRKPGGKRQG
jgi:hypothetical protein